MKPVKEKKTGEEKKNHFRKLKKIKAKFHLRKFLLIQKAGCLELLLRGHLFGQEVF